MKGSTLGKGLLGLACAMGIIASMTLGGCAKDRKKADLALQESSELRQRNEALHQSVRDKDSKIAELETALATMRTQQPSVTYVPSAPVNIQPTSPVPSGPVWQGGNTGSEFTNDGRGNMVATIAGNVLFDSGRATIKDSAKQQLDKIARELKSTYSNAAIRVEGHTDSDPIKQSNWKSNEHLSQARADAVMKYLASKGVSTSRMTSVGLGSSQPKGSKAASRRVEIVVSR